jgi:hypothetical protein
MITAVAGSTQATADEYRQINRLARRIDNTAAAIARETKNFIQSPHYGSLVTETQSLRQFACHIRDVARQGCDLHHLQHDVIGLGNAYSGLDAKLCLIERSNPGCYRARRIRRLLVSVQSDIQSTTRLVTCLLNSSRPNLPVPANQHPGYHSAPYGAETNFQYQESWFDHGFRHRVDTGLSYGSGFVPDDTGGYKG